MHLSQENNGDSVAINISSISQEPNKDLQSNDIVGFCEETVNHLTSLIKHSALFHTVFISLMVAETLFILIAFSALLESSVLAISVAALFLTFFSYLVTRLYFNTKKTAQLSDSIDAFLESSKNCLPKKRQPIDPHYIQTACHLVGRLKGLELHLIKPPSWLQMMSSLFQKFSCFFFFEDLLKLKELLFVKVAKEHIQAIKHDPASLELHASLAKTYVLLADLFQDPKRNPSDPMLWVLTRKYSNEIQKKFINATKSALEEFKILADYIPNDPWIHTQLAYCYHDLQNPLEEIKEYCIALQMNPEDQDTLFKLGILFFEQGLNAKGLQTYEKLKKLNQDKAGSLIEYYKLITFPI